MRRWIAPAVMLSIVVVSTPATAALVAHGYLKCGESPFYDGCECRQYVRGSDQTVYPSAHPVYPDRCNLVNLQTAFEYAVDAGGRGLSVSLVRGAAYPLSGPVYETAGNEVLIDPLSGRHRVVNDGIIRAQADGQTWTSVGTGSYPLVSLPRFHGYFEYEPWGCDAANYDEPTCLRFPYHQVGLFDARGHLVTIEYLHLDGGLSAVCMPVPPLFDDWRKAYERPALLELGWSAAASGTIVHDNVIGNVVGWTAVHLGEGPLADGLPACRDVQVFANEIHDLGYNHAYEFQTPAGRAGHAYWSDGVSMACRGTVRDNVVVNATDVGIVAFTGDVSVYGNTIVSRRSKAFAAINAADELPGADGQWTANHDRTAIHSNVVRAEPGGAFDIGINLGVYGWGCTARAWPTFDRSAVFWNTIAAAGGRINYGLSVSLAYGGDGEGALFVGWRRRCNLGGGCIASPAANVFSGTFGGGRPGTGCGAPAAAPGPYVVNTCVNCLLQAGHASSPGYRGLLGGIDPENPGYCRPPRRRITRSEPTPAP